MFDLFIRGGSILDGTGSPAIRANIGIKDGKIAYIGRCVFEAKEVIDASGLTVTPGFIDTHAHSDYSVLPFSDLTEKAEQGITTVIGGNCGQSVAPLSRDVPRKADENGNDTDVRRTVPTFLKAAEQTMLGVNHAFLIGHGNVREAVMGMENRPCTEEELEEMKRIVSDGLDAGAVGVSFGLFYTPGNYADERELIEIARVSAAKGKVITAHIRNEADHLIDAVTEFLHIAEVSGARAVFSHHKSFGSKENWGKVNHSLRMIDEANENGMDVWLDVYPYTASCTSLAARFVPQKYHAMGLANVLSDRAMRDEIRKHDLAAFGEDLSWVLVTACRPYPEYAGKRLNEIALLHGKDVYETVFDMIEKDGAAKACYFTMCEEDVKTVMAHPRCMICTDSNVACGSKSYHPRLRGTFPRALGKYVREEHVTTLPDMIRKMTSLPASVFSLKGKGLIRKGMDADLCIFDADTIIDKSDYVSPTVKNEGLNYVIVGGKVAVTDGVYQNVRNGKTVLNRADE